ncbi:hypothetical protein ACWEN4_26900 [Streptomyces violaceorubidus]
MPETITMPLAPMEPNDVADAFAYIRAPLVGDIDTASAIADNTGPEQLHRLLVDVAARVFIPVTAADDHDGEPCAHSFLAAALGRLLLELLCHGVCLNSLTGAADTITRFTDNILTEDGDLAGVLRQLEAAGMRQAMEAHPAHRTTVARSTAPSHHTAGRQQRCPPASPHRAGPRHGRAGSSITHPLDRDLIAEPTPAMARENVAVAELDKGV